MLNKLCKTERRKLSPMNLMCPFCASTPGPAIEEEAGEWLLSWPVLPRFNHLTDKSKILSSHSRPLTSFSSEKRKPTDAVQSFVSASGPWSCLPILTFLWNWSIYMQGNNFLFHKIKGISKRREMEFWSNSCHCLQCPQSLSYFLPIIPTDCPSCSFNEVHKHLPS